MMEAAKGMGATNTPQGVYVQRRLDSAHKRYLHAVRQLATVRRLMRLGAAGARVAAQSPGEKKGPGRPRKQPAAEAATPGPPE